MTWAKLDDNFAQHPKVAGLSDGAFRLHVTAICYAAKYQTLGEITPAALRAIQGKAQRVTELVDSRLWETTSRGSWTIHDFSEYNPPKPTGDELSQKRASAGKVGGQKSGEARRSKSEANLLFASEAPSRPVPSQETTSLLPDRETSSLSPGERDILETALSALPQKYRYDENTHSEMTLFATDFAGKHVELANAISECRRSRELCFPGNLRKYMPGARERSRNGRDDILSPRKAAAIAELKGDD